MILFSHASRLFKEELVEVRPVYRSVTESAGLIFLRLVVECGGGWSPDINGESMALQTQQVHLAALQQSRIGRTVGRMA